MVRAIQKGEKTVTRRIIKPQPTYSSQDGFSYRGRAYGTDLPPTIEGACNNLRCAASYQANDVLYVRESWLKTKRGEIYKYRADCYDSEARLCKWHPSIHMPKEATRIFLRVKDVKVQHVHDMRLADFLAEGVMLTREELQDQDTALYKARQQFKEIWNSTVGKPGTKEYQMYNWDANPLVWVIEFRRINGVCLKNVSCPYYQPYEQCAINGCMFGASSEDAEGDRLCMKDVNEKGECL